MRRPCPTSDDSAATQDRGAARVALLRPGWMRSSPATRRPPPLRTTGRRASRHSRHARFAQAMRALPVCKFRRLDLVLSGRPRRAGGDARICLNGTAARDRSRHPRHCRDPSKRKRGDHGRRACSARASACQGKSGGAAARQVLRPVSDRRRTARPPTVLEGVSPTRAGRQGVRPVVPAALPETKTARRSVTSTMCARREAPIVCERSSDDVARPSDL